MSKIVLKFHDKERELDLENADDQKKIKELAEKGYAYEEGQTKLKSVEEERAKLKEVLDGWNNRLELAKTDPEAKKALLSDFERLGISIEKGDDFIKDESDKRLDELAKEIGELKKENSRLQGFVLSQVYDAEHSQLEGKYTKDNGFPDYDRKAVQEYADKHGIVNFETAYLEMNKNDIIKFQVEFQAKKEKEQKEKIDRVAAKEPDKGGLPPARPKVYKKYSEASAEWAKEIASGKAEPLFID